MSKRKGVSAEEKRTRLLQIFYEKKEFFQLKDLEKIAPKEKGIIANSVKEVLQKLVEDGLVDTDKIGTSVYFWAFPSKAKHGLKRKLQDLHEKFDQSNKKLKLSENEIERLDVNEDDDKRNKLIEEISDLQIELDELKQRLAKREDANPKTLEIRKAKLESLRDAANRWTDNIFSIKSWCKNKFGMEESVINKQLRIPEDLDYIE